MYTIDRVNALRAEYGVARSLFSTSHDVLNDLDLRAGIDTAPGPRRWNGLHYVPSVPLGARITAHEEHLARSRRLAKFADRMRAGYMFWLGAAGEFPRTYIPSETERQDLLKRLQEAQNFDTFKGGGLP